jgi:ribonucleotide monophosphatase NagD (HAD superfamily)
MIGNDKSSDIAGANNFGIDSLYFYSNISPKEDPQIESKATFTLDCVDYETIKKLIIK